MKSPPLKFINFFIGKTNDFIILQKFFLLLEFWSKNKQLHFQTKFRANCLKNSKVFWGVCLELVSKELNHFGVIADLFRQIGGHSSRFVLFCSFWKLFTIKVIKSVKVFPFSFWKIIFFFLLHKIQTPGINMQNGRQVI